jgi:hypothetical protein
MFRTDWNVLLYPRVSVPFVGNFYVQSAAHLEKCRLRRTRFRLDPVLVRGDRRGYSYTQISQYLSCPRRYRYRYLDGGREKDTRATIVFGRAFEQALSA